MDAGEVGGGIGGAGQVGQNHRARASRQQHQRTVHDVLTGGARVHHGGRHTFLSHPFAQHLHQRNDGISAGGRRAAERHDVQTARL